MADSSAEEIARLRESRRRKLLQDWGAGKKLPSDTLAEIADLIAPLPALPAEPVPVPVAAPLFVLQPGVPLPRKIRFARNLCDYAPACGVGWRTLKRWVSKGRAASPPDLPPFDEPSRLAAWYRLHMQGTPPDLLLALESSAVPAPAVMVPPADLAETGELPAMPALPGKEGITKIQLGDLQFGEGEAVRQARAVAAANYQRVADASKGGDSEAYRRWMPVWRDSLKLHSDLETRDIAMREKIGALVPREPVLAELSQLAETLRVLNDSKPRRILAELAKSPRARHRRVLRLLTAELESATLAVCAADVEILRNVESLDAPPVVAVAA